MKHIRSALIAVATGLAAVAVSAQPLEPVPGEMRYASQAEARPAETWRAPVLAKSAPAALTLLPMARERIDSVQAYNNAPGVKALQIGIDRPLRSETATPAPIEAPDWQPVAGGWVAYTEIVSPEAEGLRAALTLDNLPDSAEIRIAGDAFPDLVYAETVADARAQLDGNGWYWTSVTDGERMRLELFVPDADADDIEHLRLDITTVAHLLVPLHGSGSLAKALGDSGSCNINVACRDSLGEAFRIAKNAVAHMVFQRSGSGYICTGTLLNDLDTSTEKLWFYSAHHCISTQAVASTLRTFWQYEAPTCSANSAGPNRQMAGGADFLWSSAGTDAALLELRGTLPDVDIGFAGWDANPIGGSGTQVAAIHHPSGDNKKYSRGVFQGTQTTTISNQTVSNANIVSWVDGTTEGGSSGGGLFTWNSQDYFLRGGLFGGAASCSNRDQPVASGNWDAYSRFDLVFPNIQQYIAADGGGGGGGPTRDNTGAWYVPAESGWGLLVHQYPDQLFVAWFTFDEQGRRAWYQLLPEWTGTNVASGTVRRPSGPNWGPSFNPAGVSFANAGTFTLDFTSAQQAIFTFNVDGVQRTVTLFKL